MPKSEKNAPKNAQQTAQTTKNEKIPLELRFKNLSLYVSPQPTASLRIKECVGFLQKKSMQNWQEEILEFQNSGESAVQFCKKRGLKISTFRYHLKKQQVSSGFLEILPSQSGVRFEVQYPNGVRLLIHGEISHSQLKGFLDV